MTRILTAILAFALLGLTPLAYASPATADGSARSVSKAAVTVKAKAKEKRDLNDSYERRPNGQYVIFGKATPEGGNKVIILKRKDCKTCDFKLFKKQKTKANGKFEFVISFPTSSKPTWVYRGFMPGGKKYKTSRTVPYVACARVSC